MHFTERERESKRERKEIYGEGETEGDIKKVRKMDRWRGMEEGRMER